MKIHEVPRRFLRSFLEFFFLTAVIFFVFFSPWFYGLARFRDQLIAELFIFVLFLFLIPSLKIKSLFRMGPKHLDFWILAGLGLCFLYVLISVIPSRSWVAFTLFFSIVLFYWMIRTVVDSGKKFDLFVWLIFSMGFFYSVYGLLQYQGYLPKDFWYQDCFLASRFVNGGHFAVFLLFPFFLGLGLWVNVGWIRRIVMLPMAFIQCWALLLTQARTVWIALTVSVLICGIRFLRGKFFNLKPILFVLIICWAGFLNSGFGIFSFISERFTQMRTIHEIPFYTLVFRFELWEACLQAFISRPWGWGLGVFSAVFPAFRINDDRFLIDYAHNEFCQIGVDLGAGGIFFLAAFAVFYLKTGFRQMTFKTSSHPVSFSPGRVVFNKTGIYACVFTALFIGLFISVQFDFPLRIYSNGLLFALFLGLSAHLFDGPAHAEKLKVSRPFQSVVLKSLIFMIVLGFVIFTASYLYAQVLFEKGKTLESQFEWENARGAMEKAVSLMPFSEDYHQGLGELYEKMSALSFDSEQRKLMRARSIASYQKAAQINLYEPRNHYFLAKLFEGEGDFQKAGLEFEKAIDRDPLNGFYVLEYGYFALRHSQVEKAVNLFERFKSYKFREYPGGDICEILNKLNEKTQRYDDLKRIISDEWSRHYCLGAVLAKNDQWESARVEYARALEQARMAMPTAQYHENVRRQIVASYVAAGYRRDAVSIYMEDLRINPQDVNAEQEMRVLSKNPV